MREKKYFILFLLSVIFVTACKKKSKPEVDENYPVITINSPLNGTTFNMFDTIRIIADVSDDKNLSVVSVGITDANYIPVQSAVTFTPANNQLNLNIGYQIYEYRLKTGIYNITIHASDGENELDYSRKFYLIESPTRKLGYYVFSQGINTHALQQLDTLYAVKNTINYNGNYNGSALSNYYQRLYLNGSSFEPFQAYEYGNSVAKWGITNSGGNSPYFSFCDSDSKNAFVGFTSGNIVKYDYNGTQNTVYTYANSEYFALHGLASGSRYITYFQSRVIATKRKLIVFDVNNGTGINETNIQFNVLDMFEKTGAESYILGNDDNGFGVLYVYNSVTGNLYNPINLNSAKIVCACSINNNTLLIGMDDASVYKYEYSTGNLISVINGLNASKIKFSSSENLVYIAEGSLLKIYSINNFSAPIKTFNNTTNIVDFQVIFNK